MKYVIMEKGYVIWGPRDWNFRSIENCILDDCEITVKVPTYEPKEIITVDNNIKILPCRVDTPDYNPMVQVLAGPYWDVENGLAIGSYTVVPCDINLAKSKFKAKVAANRFRDETKDINLNIQGTDIIVEGDRMNKMTIMLMTSAMNDIDTYNFKFPKSGNWLPMTKADMYTLIGAFLLQTQTAFDWEAAKVAEIDSCNVIYDLLNIDVGDIIPTVG